MKKIAIIGAGISGLSLGYLLSKKCHVTIFEKSRNVSGRMSSRRNQKFIYDHGCPFFTAKSTEFQKFLEVFIKKGSIGIWKARFAEIVGTKITNITQWDNSPKHFVSLPNMTDWAKALAKNQNVILNTEITSLKYSADSMALEAKDNIFRGFDYAITAIPSQQTLNILPKKCNYIKTIGNKIMLPCFGLMVTFEKPLDIKFDAAIVKKSDISWISSMDSKHGRENQNSYVILSTNAWASKNFEMEKSIAIDWLLKEFQKTIKIELPNILVKDLQKWKFANIKKQKYVSPYFDDINRIGSIGDWCVQGKVEGAFLSALRMYQMLQKNII